MNRMKGHIGLGKDAKVDLKIVEIIESKFLSMSNDVY